MYADMGNIWSQSFPPAPQFTEKDVPDLWGKVYIVTGSSSGIGKELAKILYTKNAKVYIAARSESKALDVINEIRAASPSSKGSLIFMKLDLADLTTIKASVEEFLSKENKLHVLVNNAGVMAVAKIPERTVQGYEMNLGVNNVGVFLFTKLLTPILHATAQSVPGNTVRVVWLSSTIDFAAVKGVGVPLDNLDYHKEVSGFDRYGLSKVGSWFQAVEFAKLHKKDGIISVALNPGNLATDLVREHTKFMQWVLSFAFHPASLGACSMIFACESPDVTLEKTGAFIWPWGRFGTPRKDLDITIKSEAEGGNDNARKFWEWNEQQVKKYL